MLQKYIRETVKNKYIKLTAHRNLLTIMFFLTFHSLCGANNSLDYNILSNISIL